MRWMRLTVVMVLASVSVAAGAGGSGETVVDAPRVAVAPAGWEIVPGERIGPYRIGMAMEKVIAELGEPDWTFAAGDESGLTYNVYRDVGISFHAREGAVVGLTSLSPRHGIAGGPAVGMELDAALARWEKTLGRELEYYINPESGYCWIPEFGILLEPDADGVIREVNIEPRRLLAAAEEPPVPSLPVPQVSREVRDAHQERLAGTGVTLDDYDLVSVRPVEADLGYEYSLSDAARRRAPGRLSATGVLELWRSMPAIATVVVQYGLPPTVTIADARGARHLNLYYDSAHLYAGHSSADLLEIRLRRGLGDEVRYRGVGVGSTLDEVTAAFGKPVRTVRGDIEYEDRVLYLDQDRGYIAYRSEGVRFFLNEEEGGVIVSAMYLFAPER
jgi:hypothetical protein